MAQDRVLVTVMAARPVNRPALVRFVMKAGITKTKPKGKVSFTFETDPSTALSILLDLKDRFPRAYWWGATEDTSA